MNNLDVNAFLSEAILSDTSSENIVGNIFGGLQASKTKGSFYMLLTPEIMR